MMLACSPLWSATTVVHFTARLGGRCLLAADGLGFIHLCYLGVIAYDHSWELMAFRS